MHQAFLCKRTCISAPSIARAFALSLKKTVSFRILANISTGPVNASQYNIRIF